MTKTEPTIFDKIRQNADEKRKAKLAKQNELDDFLRSVRDGETELTEK